jgi:hypothetical protein
MLMLREIVYYIWFFCVCCGCEKSQIAVLLLLTCIQQIQKPNQYLWQDWIEQIANDEKKQKITPQFVQIAENWEYVELVTCRLVASTWYMFEFGSHGEWQWISWFTVQVVLEEGSYCYEPGTNAFSSFKVNPT